MKITVPSRHMPDDPAVNVTLNGGIAEGLVRLEIQHMILLLGDYSSH